MPFVNPESKQLSKKQLIFNNEVFLADRSWATISGAETWSILFEVSQVMQNTDSMSFSTCSLFCPPAFTKTVFVNLGVQRDIKQSNMFVKCGCGHHLYRVICMQHSQHTALLMTLQSMLIKVSANTWMVLVRLWFRKSLWLRESLPFTTSTGGDCQEHSNRKARGQSIGV